MSDFTLPSDWRAIAARYTLDQLRVVPPLAAQQAEGRDSPGWKVIAEAVGRDPSNARRTLRLLESDGLIGLTPIAVPAILADHIAGLLEAHASGVIRPAAGPAPDPATAGGEPIHPIAHNAIRPSPLNPRKSFDSAALDQLAEDIAEHGLLQPILVRPVTGDAHGRTYEIVFGERRWRAFERMLMEQGRPEDAPIRAMIEPMSDVEALARMLAENAARADVHPLEEGEGYLALYRMRAAAGEGDEKTVTAEIAARLGGPRRLRYVQKRIRLARGLAPELRAAWLKGRINQAQAEAVCGYDHTRQRGALTALEAGYSGWRRASDIAANMARDGLLERHAMFDDAAYEGERAEDAEKGEIVYLDRAQAERLQREALPARAAELQAEGWAFVEIKDPLYGDHPGFEPAPDGLKSDRAATGLFIGLNPHSLECQLMPVLRATRAEARAQDGQGDQDDAPAPAGTGEATEDADADAGPEPAPPFAARHWEGARRDKTARLQRAIAAAPTRVAMAIALIALRAGHELMTAAPTHWISGSTLLRGELRAGHLALKAEAETLIAGRETDALGLKIDRGQLVVTNAVLALDALLEAPNLDRLFAAAIAVECGQSPTGFTPAGDSAFVRALAERLGETLPAFEMTADYLGRFQIAQLRAIADACIRQVEGQPQPSAAMPAKKAQAIAWILDHPDRDRGWIPPEQAFGAPGRIEAEVKAMLAGAAAASPNEAGQP